MMSKIIDLNLYLDSIGVFVGVIGGFAWMWVKEQSWHEWRDYTWFCVWIVQVFNVCVFIISCVFYLLWLLISSL